jgi:hypothetical protein
LDLFSQLLSRPGRDPCTTTILLSNDKVSYIFTAWQMPAGRRVHDKMTRSYIMPQIKATNIKPELPVRKFL